eukprot:COSAG01_NODE_1928_length_8876_cov_12.801641_6_plen_110_part_00
MKHQLGGTQEIRFSVLHGVFSAILALQCRLAQRVHEGCRLACSYVGSKVTIGGCSSSQSFCTGDQSLESPRACYANHPATLTQEHHDSSQITEFTHATVPKPVTDPQLY